MHVQCANCNRATAGEQAVCSPSGAAAWLKGHHADCSTAQLSAWPAVPLRLHSGCMTCVSLSIPWEPTSLAGTPCHQLLLLPCGNDLT